MQKRLSFPITDTKLFYSLRTGDFVLLTGTIYTARDQAHKKLLSLIDAGEKLPFPLDNNAIYYCGPTPPRLDNIFGSAGPTTSVRMDTLTLPLLKLGLKATIGKGGRSDTIRQACADYKAIYFATFGGAGAYIAKTIVKQETIAFPELGAEAIYRLEVANFPVVVAYDTDSGSIY